MEKQLSGIGYWLGLICTVLALFFRMLTAIHRIPPFMGAPGGDAISYSSFLHGAALFFLLTIASRCRTAKSLASSRTNLLHQFESPSVGEPVGQLPEMLWRRSSIILSMVLDRRMISPSRRSRRS